MLDELKQKLEKLATQKTWQDIDRENREVYDIREWAGGNLHDAFEGGYHDGRVELARELLEMLK